MLRDFFRHVDNEPAGPSRFRNVSLAYKGPSERDEKLCRALCKKGEDSLTDHRTSCRVGIRDFNQYVNNRQVRRAYARIMAKREKSRG